MKFTTLRNELRQTYREQPPRFHVLAARYYLGLETRQTLSRYLSDEAVDAIVQNR